ncbi:MAG: peptidyl-prolyl cis-trans isomerase [Candidatus Eisenbacteria bacterium]|nr:peptidyl-prolyl cis-trans isomerase [Candidatus Eisenbacteria bacterium]
MRYASIAVLFLLVAVHSLYAKEEAGVKPGSKSPVVLAIVNGVPITSADLDAEIEQYGQKDRIRLDSPSSKRVILDRLVDDWLWLKAANDSGLRNDPEFLKRMKIGERRVLLSLFYEKEIVGGAAPSDEEVKKYYDEHLKNYELKERVYLKHMVLPTEQEALAVKKALDAGGSFEKLAKEKSTDQATKDNGGRVGFVMKGMAVKLLGSASDTLVTEALQLEVGKASKVIRTSKGFEILEIDSKENARTKTLDEVRSQIRENLQGKRTSQLQNEIYEELKKNAKVEVNEEALINYLAEKMTPPELFDAAQKASTPFERIKYYQRIVTAFPDSAQAPQAQFMIGFTYSEELGDYANAETSFDAMLRRYPKSDLIPSAKWMMKNMKESRPKLKGLEDVKKASKEKPDEPKGGKKKEDKKK